MTFQPEVNRRLSIDNPGDKPLPPDAGKEIVRRGDLVAFLRSEFLAGYLADKLDAHPEYEHVPAAIEDVLAPLFDSPDVERLVLTSSVAKCIAAGVPQYFWEYRKYFRSKAEELKTQGEEHAAKLLSDLSGEPDMDWKVQWRNGGSMTSLSRQVAARFGVLDEDIQVEEVGRDNGNVYVRETFEFQMDDRFRLSVSAGAIATNFKRNLMIVTVKDAASGEKLFHVDIGELTTEAEAMYADKRIGATSDKQDTCVAQLRYADRHIEYAMTREAQEVMTGPDAIVTELDDPAGVVEIALRALRMNLLHEVKEQVGLGEFTSYIKSQSLFELQTRMQTFVLEGRRFSPNVLPLLQKELAVCMTIDPYGTVQFLRDSGISLLIPGLRRVTRGQWNEILRTKNFTVGLLDEQRAPRAQQRTLEFMEGQRELYRYGDPGVQVPKQYNGLERFIHALQAINVASKDIPPWTLYAGLWETPQKSKILFTPVEQHFNAIREVRQAARITVDGKPFFIIVSDPEKVTTAELEKLGQQVLDSAKPGRSHPERLRAAASLVFNNAQGTYLGDRMNRHAVLKAKLTKEKVALNQAEKGELVDTWNRIQSVGSLLMVLDQFPSGLTAKQLQHQYATQHLYADQIANFDVILFYLKSLGLVQKDELNRTTAHNTRQKVAFYSLETNRSPQRLDLLVHSQSFVRFCEDNAERILDWHWSLERETNFALAAGQCVREFRIPTVQAFLSLADIDWDFIWEGSPEIGVQGQTYQNLRPLLMDLQLIVQHYEELGDDIEV